MPFSLIFVVAGLWLLWVVPDTPETTMAWLSGVLLMGGLLTLERR
jgi:hypothetical protein